MRSVRIVLIDVFGDVAFLNILVFKARATSTQWIGVEEKIINIEAKFSSITNLGMYRPVERTLAVRCTRRPDHCIYWDKDIFLIIHSADPLTKTHH